MCVCFFFLFGSFRCCSVGLLGVCLFYCGVCVCGVCACVRACVCVCLGWVDEGLELGASTSGLWYLCVPSHSLCVCVCVCFQGGCFFFVWFFLVLFCWFAGGVFVLLCVCARARVRAYVRACVYVCFRGGWMRGWSWVLLHLNYGNLCVPSHSLCVCL